MVLLRFSGRRGVRPRMFYSLQLHVENLRDEHCHEPLVSKPHRTNSAHEVMAYLSGEKEPY